MNKPVLMKNDVVECPNCHLEVGVVTRDCFAGEILHPNMFAFTHHPYEVHELAECIECKEAWADFGNVYLKTYGWT